MSTPVDTDTPVVNDIDLFNMDDEEFEKALLAAETGEVTQQGSIEEVSTDEGTDQEPVLEQSDENSSIGGDVVEPDNGSDVTKSTDEVTNEQPVKGDGTDQSGDGGSDTKDKDEDDSAGDAGSTGGKTVDSKPVEEEKFKYKANGQEVEFTRKEVEDRFGEMYAKAMNYTQKMQAMAKYKKELNTIKEHNLTQDHLNLMIDVLENKDKNAAAELLKMAGVDPVDALDIDLENSNYQPTNYGKSDEEIGVQEVLESISTRPRFEVTADVIGNHWDETSRSEFAANPGLIEKLQVDVEDGTFDKVNAIAQKLKVFDGGTKSDMAYYRQAGAQYYAQQAPVVPKTPVVDTRMAELEAREKALAEKEAQLAKIEQVKAEEAKRQADAQAAQGRRVAAPTASRAGKPDAMDYMNLDAMSDDEFSAYMDKYAK